PCVAAAFASVETARRPRQVHCLIHCGLTSMRFDALKLSASGESLFGEVDAADLPRIVDRVAANAGSARVAWKLVGGHDVQRRPSLTLTLKGSVPLVCQRCLRPC